MLIRLELQLAHPPKVPGAVGIAWALERAEVRIRRPRPVPRTPIRRADEGCADGRHAEGPSPHLIRAWRHAPKFLC